MKKIDNGAAIEAYIREKGLRSDRQNGVTIEFGEVNRVCQVKERDRFTVKLFLDRV